MSDWTYMCSFCQKNDKQVRHMWVIKHHRICVECAKNYADWFKDETDKAAQSAAAFQLIGTALTNPPLDRE